MEGIKIDNKIFQWEKVIKEKEAELKILKSQLVQESKNFIMWYKYSEKVHHKYLLGIDTPVRNLIDKHLPFLYSERKRIIDVDFILTALEELLFNQDIDEVEVERVKFYMMKTNFGSMCIDWI